jgi:amidase
VGGPTSDATATAPARELARAVRTGQVASRELLDLYLDRIERLNPAINAVVTLDVERARAAARRADEATAMSTGEDLGPLYGLPITVKDAIATEGIRSTGGSTQLADHVPAEDAPAVARLKEAGAIVFGKTNLPEWSGDLQSFNDVFGTTNNPWDRSRTPGGSSGGAAAATVAGLTSFELGTDIGGSIRIPAHFCGAFGLKPSFGVVPQRGYLDHPAGGTIDADINVFGPIARSADDLELLLDVLAGPPPELRPAWRIDLPRAAMREPAGLRVAVWFDDEAHPVQREYRALLGRAADALADDGAKVEEACPPVDAEAQRALFSAMILAAIIHSHPAEAHALAGTHAAWLDNARARAELQRQWAAWFEGYDLLLLPVAPTPAIAHDHEGDLTGRVIEMDGTTIAYLEAIAWTGLVGIVGLPAAVPPIGRTEAGLPVGVQVVAPYLHDHQAIAGARLLGTYTVPPGFE